MLFIPKVLDGLVVDDGVCGSSSCLSICFVHGLPELRAVACEAQCECRISNQGSSCQACKDWPTPPSEDACKDVAVAVLVNISDQQQEPVSSRV